MNNVQYLNKLNDKNPKTFKVGPRYSEQKYIDKYKLVYKYDFTNILG